MSLFQSWNTIRNLFPIVSPSIRRFISTTAPTSLLMRSRSRRLASPTATMTTTRITTRSLSASSESNAKTKRAKHSSVLKETKPELKHDLANSTNGTTLQKTTTKETIAGKRKPTAATIIVSTAAGVEEVVTTTRSRRKTALKISVSPENDAAKIADGQEVAADSSSRLMAHERRYWKLGCKFVVGVDEAGRGPLAGPVVVAACAIDEAADDVDSSLIDDSKKLSEEERERVFAILTKSKHVHYEIAVVDHLKIDELNILKATLFGMDEVVKKLTSKNKCDAVLVDGPFKPPVAAVEKKHIEAIKGGDSKVRAIGAASVLAKVTRDRLMKEYHLQYPHFGFDKHKGYPVKEHVRALMEHGPCEIHRRSYAPVKRALEAKEEKSK